MAEESKRIYTGASESCVRRGKGTAVKVYCWDNTYYTGDVIYLWSVCDAREPLAIFIFVLCTPNGLSSIFSFFRQSMYAVYAPTSQLRS